MAEKQILKLGALKPAAGSRPKRQRIGRGHGSGMVKTGGEGGKGQTVRSGGGKGPAFEGGQTPWARRLPHGRGYSQKARDTGHFGTRLAVVKLSRLSQWDADVEITPESLRERGVLKALRDGVKILGDGGPSVALPTGLRFRDVLFSKGAREALVAAGAQLEEAPKLVFDNLRAAVLVPEIRQRILFVFFAFAWFVFMIHVQLPNVNQEAWQRVLQSGAFYNLLGFLSGGALQKLSIIAMGITPYINASIIMQLMTVVMPQLEEMAKKGGEEGRKKISQYTRWLTIVLGTIQATFMAISMERSGVFYDTSIWYLLYAIVAMVGGTLFLMWLGEQISDKGIGNGVSLIIFIGIVLRYPQYVTQTYASASQGAESLLNLLLYIATAIIIIISIIFLYQGQRRVPVQQARRTVGRKMFAGRSTYIPLRLNNAGVISIIFAISILLLPQQALSWFGRGQVIVGTGLWPAIERGMQGFSAWLNVWFTPNGFLYNIVYFLLVVVFTFFYSSIVLNTRDVADNLKKTGAFVPGIRPGQPTVDYLNRILMRITTAAAIYLGLLAVLPGALQRGLSVTTFYLGSTSLLIVVGVALDTITQIEARLAMRDYRGFIKR